MNQQASSTQFQDRRSGTRHVWFLNSAFDRIGLDIALKRITERDPQKPFAFVVTPNVDHLVRLETDTVLATLYAQAWLTVCDSRVLELIGRFSGETIDVTPGSDLTAQLFETEIDPNETVTVIGASREVIDAVTARYGLKDVRWHEPPMGLRVAGLSRRQGRARSGLDAAFAAGMAAPSGVRAAPDVAPLSR